jgi:hypothetical protein
VQIFESGRFVGTNSSDRVPLEAGSHQLDIVSEPLKYRVRQRVDVKSGKGTVVEPTITTGTLQINANPWGEVFIDGEMVGTTPIGNLSVKIGPHAIVFRHPQLGEQSRSVVVTAGESTRVSADFRK